MSIFLINNMWFEKVKKSALLLLFFFLLFVPCFVFAQQYGPGVPCETDDECVTNLCMYDVCAMCVGDTECPTGRYCGEPTNYCFLKLGNNSSCDRDEMCESDFCDKDVCASAVKTPGCCKIGVKQGDGDGEEHLTRTKFVDSKQSCYLIFSTNDAASDIFDSKDKKEKWDFVEGTCEAGASTGASTGEAVFDIGVDASVLNKLSSTDVKTVIGTAIKTGMGLMGSIALALFVYAGMIMMVGSTSVSGGATKQDVLKAKAIMVWAVLGMFVIFASYAIVNFVFEAFK